MFKKFIILFSLIILLCIGCKSLKNKALDFKEGPLTISTTKGESFSFNSENPNLICLAFLNNFQDSIIVFNNEKSVLNFKRNDTVNYKEMSHNEIFKTIEINRKRSKNKVQICLFKEKSKISFNLVDGKSLYLISRYNKSWYLTLWEHASSSKSE